jgi:hypothetical protein
VSLLRGFLLYRPYVLKVVLVMQRCSDGIVHSPIHGELDVLQLEGLAASFGCFWVEVFSRPEEPVEGHNTEEDDVHVEGAILGVLDVEGIKKSPEDGEICRVDSSCWVIFFVEGPDKISE